MGVSIPTARSFSPAEGDVADWERHNAESLIALSCQPPSDRPFRGVEVNLQLDRVHLARVRGTAHAVVRDAPMVHAHPAEAIAVYATLRGEALLEYDGVRRVIRPGQLLVCDVDRPFLRGFGHGLEELAVKVPKQAFAELTGLPTVATPIVLDAGPGDDPYGRALVRLVGRALHSTVPLPADEQEILELVGVLATGHEASLSIAHRAAARAFIDDHLHDPTLSAADVAAGAGISDRHLSRLFAAAGTSVPRHILARRLDAAHSLLTHHPEERTVDVAARCGFTSMAYFSQSFRRRFGIAAGDLRRSASE